MDWDPETRPYYVVNVCHSEESRVFRLDEESFAPQDKARARQDDVLYLKSGGSLVRRSAQDDVASL